MSALNRVFQKMNCRFLLLPKLLLLMLLISLASGATASAQATAMAPAGGSSVAVGSVADSRFGTGYTLNGSALTDTRAKLLSLTNFGPGGTVPFALTISDTAATVNSINLTLLNNFDIFFIGFLGDSHPNAFTAAELAAMQSWVQNGGRMIITCDEANYDAVCAYFGYPSSTSSTSPLTPTAAGLTHPIFDGPFGQVPSANMLGTLGYFNNTTGADVLARDPSSRAIVIQIPENGNGGTAVLISDVNIISNGTISSGSTITNNNDRFLGNLFAYLGDFLQVGDYVWQDVNQDGVQNGGENGLNGVTVRLYADADSDGLAEPNGDDGAAVATTVTANNGGSDGYYNLPPPAAGDYFLEFEQPAGYTFSSQDQGGDDALDSDADPATGLTAVFNLTDADTSRDAGLYGSPASVVSDFVWSDSDGDGIQDGGENGLNGITVRLYQDDGDSTPQPATDYLIATTTTANNGFDGYYDFDQLAAGDYFVQFVAPGMSVFTMRDQGGDDTLDSDANPADGLTTIFTLAAAQTDSTRDAGLLATVSNSCNVAVVGDGSAGYAATVTSLNDDTFHDFTATSVAPAGIDTAAELAAYDAVVIGYNFEAGTPYTIYQNALRTWVEGGGGVVGVGFLDWNVPSATDLAAIMPINMANSGSYVSNGTVTISGAHDVTAGVSTFAATGCYVEIPAGLAGGATSLGTTGASPTVAVKEPVSGRSVYLGPAYSYYSASCPAGAWRTAGSNGDHLLENAVAWAGSCQAATLGDYVWDDSDRDGIQDGGESGINGVTVHLYEDADYDSIAEPGGDDGSPVDTTTTVNNGGNDGYYQFSVSTGHYFVEFVSPTGAFSPQDQGGDDTLDSDVDPATGLSDVFTFFAADNSLDAGIVPACIASAQSGPWSNIATWVGGVVPGSSDGVCVQNGHTISLSSNAAIDTLTVMPGGTLDLDINSVTVENGVVNDGTLQQTRTVNNAVVDFLHIQNVAATVTQYRGVQLDTTANSQDLGLTTVSVRELNAGEYCTNTGSGSPAYTRRCFEITPASQPIANVLVRLYARTADERNGIAESSLMVYRYMGGGSWVPGGNTVTGNVDAYSYAQGEVAGFSAFLLGEVGQTPTAVVTLQAIIVPPQFSLALMAGLLALLLLSITILALRQRDTNN